MLKFSPIRVLLCLIFYLGLLGCSNPHEPENRGLEKIKFDLSEIDSEGLIGPADGKRSISYEFCIPASETQLEEVKAIAPSLHYYSSPGRIGCQSNEYLCIVDTHGPQWQEILLNLAQLPYIQKILQSYGE